MGAVPGCQSSAFPLGLCRVFFLCFVGARRVRVRFDFGTGIPDKKYPSLPRLVSLFRTVGVSLDW